jgi:O-antigen biosynthesis protein
MMRRIGRLWERHSDWRTMTEVGDSGVQLLRDPCQIRSDSHGVEGLLERIEFRDGELRASGWALCRGRPLRSTRVVLANGIRWAHMEATVGVQRDDLAAVSDAREFIAPGFVLTSSEPIPLAGDIRLDLDFVDGTRTSVEIGSYNLVRKRGCIGRRAAQFLRFYASEVAPRWPMFVNSTTRQMARKAITSKLDIEQFFARRAMPVDRREFLPGHVSFAPLPEPVDIVIPIHNGAAYLSELFARLAIHTTTPHRLIVVDDASSDAGVVEFLGQLRPAGDWCLEIELIRNEINLGFVASANRGLAACRHHAVVMNSDVRVPANWLERLMRPIFDDARVASTTPFSNRATICSFPNFCRDNDMLLGLDVDAIDRHFRAVRPPAFPVELPTGLGFCMGMSRHFLERIGHFDEQTFGRGYGEENDWCCRAAQVGGSHALVENLFVEHDHGGSFTAAEKKQLMDANLKKLAVRHPAYFPRVHHFIARDPSATLRALMVARIAAFEGRHAFEIIIDHDLGGGANKYRQNRTNKYVEKRRPFARIKPNGNGLTEFIVYCGDQFQSFHFESWQTLNTIFAPRGDATAGRGGKSRIVWLVNNMVGFAKVPEILKFLVGRKESFGDRIQVMAHDFLAVCPSYNLLNGKARYCGVPSLARCRTCLPENPFAAPNARRMPIETWRGAWGRLLRAADRIVHFSEASREVLGKAYPDLGDNVVVKPHRLNWARRRKLKVFPIRPGERLRIGVAGSIGDAKGGAMVVKAARVIARQKLDAEIVVLGRLGRAAKSDRLRVLGPYKTNELAKLIERERIHVFWVPSIWPETYSYVTTELMRLNVPVACFNLGAPPERVARYPLGRVIERIDAALAVRELMALARRANGLALARLAPARLAPARLAPERQPVSVSRSADPPTVVVRAGPTRSAEAAAARP